MRFGSGPPSISSVAPARARKRPPYCSIVAPTARPIGLHRGRVGDLEFDDKIGGYGGLPWRTIWELAAYGPCAPEPRDRVISLYASYFPVE